MTRSLMIHSGRCGSTVVATQLWQHPEISWKGEIYERVFQSWERLGGDVRCERREWQPWTLPAPYEVHPAGVPLNPLEHIDRRLERCDAEHFGFEVKPFHWRLLKVDPDDWLAGIRERNFSHFIMLWRRNTLRKLVSSLVAKARGKAHSSTPLGLLAVEVGVDRVFYDRNGGPLLEALQGADDDRARVRQLLQGQPYLELEYETHVEQDPRIAYALVRDHLGLDHRDDVRVKLARTTAHPLTRVISNYDEVAAALAGTRWAWMLEE